MKSLNEEMLLNQQQKNQIEILKKKLNDSMKNKTKLTKNDKDKNDAEYAQFQYDSKLNKV